MSENKRYYWLKLKENFFSQRDIKVIRKQDNGAEYIIFWQQLLLMSITSKEIGILRYKENIPFTPELLSTITDTNIDVVKGALSLFLKLGMISQTDEGDIIIDELIHDLIGSETSVAERVRKHREKNKMLQCNKKKQICNTEIEIEIEIEKEIEKEKDTPPLKKPIKKINKKDNIISKDEEKELRKKIKEFLQSESKRIHGQSYYHDKKQVGSISNIIKRGMIGAKNIEDVKLNISIKLKTLISNVENPKNDFQASLSVCPSTVISQWNNLNPIKSVKKTKSKSLYEDL